MVQQRQVRLFVNPKWHTAYLMVGRSKVQVPVDAFELHSEADAPPTAPDPSWMLTQPKRELKITLKQGQFQIIFQDDGVDGPLDADTIE